MSFFIINDYIDEKSLIATKLNNLYDYIYQMHPNMMTSFKSDLSLTLTICIKTHKNLFKRGTVVEIFFTVTMKESPTH